jgi:hypothetical protein
VNLLPAPVNPAVRQDVEDRAVAPTYRREAPTDAPDSRGADVKYLLTITMNPELFESLPEPERRAVFAGHDAFQQPLRESGELVGFAALADPSNSTTVTVRDGVPAVTGGPYVEAKEFLAGFYIVDCETPQRAHELAAQIPDARLTAVEVRPVMAASGLEM